MTIFIDRQGENLNRKKLKIVSQTANEIIADIERGDDAIVEGTPINAAAMNSLKSTIDSADINATTALNIANEAMAIANAVEDAVAVGKGTVVYINDDPKASIGFSSDPQAQINNIVNNTTKLTNEYGGFAAGNNSNATANNSVQLGTGANSTENTMQYMSNKIADSDGQIYSKGEKVITKSTSIGKEELITANSTYANGTYSLPMGKNFSNYSLLNFIFYSSSDGRYRSLTISYEAFKQYKYFSLNDDTPNTSRYMFFEYTNDTQYYIGSNAYVEFRAIYGIKKGDE